MGAAVTLSAVRTLKSLLAYPHAAAQFTPEAYREVLDATGLLH